MDPAVAGGRDRPWAAYARGSGTTELIFAFEVQPPYNSTGGVAVVANSLVNRGDWIRSTATGVFAAVAHPGLDHDPGHKVNSWVSSAAPTVAAVAVTSRPASGDTYLLGETIRVQVTFSEAVDVSGAPRLKIDMDPAYWGQKWATYEGGSGTTTLTFTHTVVEPNYSTQGIAILANTLALNGGDIESAATDTDADLSHDGLGHDPGHKVNWRS